MSSITSAYYERWWKEQQGPEALDYNYKFKKVASLIPDGSRVIEFGCGNGVLLHYLKEHKHCEVFGIELSPTAAALAKKKGIPVIQANVEERLPKLPKNFDFCLALDFLEHLYYPTLFLDNIAKISKVYLFAVPNTAWWKSRVFLLFGRILYQNSFQNGQHLHYWTYRGVRDFLLHAGYRILRDYPSPNFPLVGRFSSRLNELLTSLNKNLFALGGIYVCQYGQC